MFNWFNKKKEESVIEAPVVVAEQPKPKKPKKPRVKKEKVVPPKVGPKVDILKFDFDPKDPRLGSIELDWNTEFVELLIEHGYFGNTEEDIVDKWLNDVCRNIVANQYPGANTSMALSGANIVNKKDLGSGKTEVS